MKELLTILICFTSFFLNGQSNITINLAPKTLKNLEKHEIDILDKTTIYIGDGYANDLFYYALKPKRKIKGTLIMLPPTGQTVEVVINHNIELLELAYEQGLLVVVPSINFNLCLDKTAMTFLNTTFKAIFKTYKAPKDKVVISGFSLGGMNAIRYTQLAYEDEKQTVIKPTAVYGVDPPLDWSRIYYSFERTIEKNFSEPAIQEAEIYLKKLKAGFGGTPQEKPEIYAQYSMYSRTEKNGGNTKFLVNVPIRIYSDPDIDWHLKNRHSDFYDINALDQTAMINQLHLLGNEKAEYVNALGKGYRLDGRRHPHSWSLVEPKDCIAWIFKCFE